MVTERNVVRNIHWRHRAIWLSDIHLGTKGCNTDFLLDFLRCNDSEYLYLVGDIIDGWQLRRSWYWDQRHNDVIQEILRKARKGTRVIFVPGNHDEFARGYVDHVFGGITVMMNAIHEMRDGRRLLVTHGDEFDCVVRYARWLALLGDIAYQGALVLNYWFNGIRRYLGYPYWSLSAYLKHKVKNAMNFIDDYEKLVAQEASIRGMDGVVCGHIHKAEMKDINGILYCNDGDWVENCTALVESLDGRLQILHWSDAGRTVINTEADATPAAA
jgi:UDP-2,3-diacylglucosamine pyrophosphatase LpxH